MTSRLSPGGKTPRKWVAGGRLQGYGLAALASAGKSA